MSLGKVVVAGGTGFVGSRLVKTLFDRGCAVTVLTRSKSSAKHLPSSVGIQVWTAGKKDVGYDPKALQNCLKGADLIVNLCGSPVVSRWDAEGKASILQSRVLATNALAEAIAALPIAERPKCLVSASAVGYYGVSQTAEFDEQSSAAPNDFLADVCKEWENAAKQIESLEGTRLVIIRTGIVLGLGGGALGRMLPFFKLFIGGPVGSGKQWVSWIHIDDLVNMYIKAGELEVSGIYNGTAPNPVTMADFSASLARAFNRPNLFPVPSFVLKFALGEGSSVVLDGQKVVPKQWLRDNFEFKYKSIDDAMRAIAME